MPIFAVIDTTSTGDTVYQGFVDAAANFATLETEITNLRDGQASSHAAMDLKANLAGPTFTGSVVLPTGTTGVTQSVNTNNTTLATTAFVMAQVSAPGIVVDGHTTGTSLTAAQVSGTQVHNVGQGTNDVALTLPAAAAGYSFVAIVGETQAANYWKFTAGAGDKIYLDGVAGTDAQSAINAAPTIGDYAAFFTFKSGSSTYDWICRSVAGTWTAGA